MKKFALAGNPNSGKTTLFNYLTGSTAHVGNWPGVTVDKKEGVYKKCPEPVNIIDLPGIYSLSPYTPEEVISRNYILDEKPDYARRSHFEELHTGREARLRHQHSGRHKFGA